MLYLVVCLVLGFVGAADAASPQEVLYRIKDMQYDIGNHEVEIRTFQEKINNLETTIESLCQAIRQNPKGSPAIDQSLQGIIADVQDLRTHANDTAKAISQLDKAIKSQNSQMGELKEAVLMLTELIQGEDGELKKYRVKSGDSLERIARRNKTSIQKLKELNHLKNNKILIDQILKIPT